MFFSYGKVRDEKVISNSSSGKAVNFIQWDGKDAQCSPPHHVFFTKTGAICAIKENVECCNKMEHSLAAKPGKAS